MTMITHLPLSLSSAHPTNLSQVLVSRMARHFAVAMKPNLGIALWWNVRYCPPFFNKVIVIDCIVSTVSIDLNNY